MLLTLDIGNTNIKSGLFVNDQLNDFKTHQTIDSVLAYIKQIDYSNVAVCSVNPTLEKNIFDEISSTQITFFKAKVNQKFNLKINYQTPYTLGMDRVCSAVGALELSLKSKLLSDKQFLITVDLGTATTINVVSPEKKFIGGSIAPGIRTMLSSLNEKTAQLPMLGLESYQGLIGNSTESSMVSGVINATIGMINEVMDKLKSESNHTPVIFVTGGNSNFILPHLKFKVNFEEALVLKGLKNIYDLNN